jgi:hypothetical protein
MKEGLQAASFKLQAGNAQYSIFSAQFQELPVAERP